MCENNTTFGMMMGHEIALTIKRAKDAGEKLALILPVGPMGMYEWAVYFLREWNVDCGHVYGFNMDEWSDETGTTLDKNNNGSFQHAMEQSFYGPLGELTVPENQRNFATRENLPAYGEKIAALKKEGAKLVTVFGIRAGCSILLSGNRISRGNTIPSGTGKSRRTGWGRTLHPLTIEQNALHSFKSRTTQVPAFANTIGPGLFLQSR